MKVTLSPGARDSRFGFTDSVIPSGAVVDTVQVAFVESALLTVRVHVHVPAQSPLARLGRLSVVGSPPVAGLAAV